MNNDKWKETIDFIKEFIKNAFSPKYNSTRVIQAEANEKMDNFIILCFGELIGLPLPFSYYSIELFPYLVQDIASWENRMLERKEVLNERWGKYDWCC